jgi:hypothetical protein
MFVMILWLVTGASLVAAVVALLWVRRVARRLEELSHLHWQLRYQYSELQTRVQALGLPPSPAAPEPRPREARETFVPLSAIRR